MKQGAQKSIWAPIIGKKQILVQNGQRINYEQQARGRRTRFVEEGEVVLNANYGPFSIEDECVQLQMLVVGGEKQQSELFKHNPFTQGTPCPCIPWCSKDFVNALCPLILTGIQRRILMFSTPQVLLSDKVVDPALFMLEYL